jgi:hypothetical protein
VNLLDEVRSHLESLVIMQVYKDKVAFQLGAHLPTFVVVLVVVTMLHLKVASQEHLP